MLEGGWTCLIRKNNLNILKFSFLYLMGPILRMTKNGFTVGMLISH